MRSKNPKIIGILNLTPDSFSDGGDYNSVDKAIKRITEMQSEGADIIDIGAESTRPNAEMITAEMEWQRLEPIVNSLDNKDNISFDTYHTETVERLLKLGIWMINDVSGLTNNRMLDLLKDYNCGFIFMHSLTIPANSEVTMQSDDIIIDMKNFIDKRLSDFDKYGIDISRAIFDPGIGFGKTAEQSYELIRRADELKTICENCGISLCYGHSRKSFLKLFTDVPPSERDIHTGFFSKQLASFRVDYLRVHNVALTAKLLKFNY